MVTEARVARVLIADDQTLFRSGLARLLDEDPRITLVGQAADGLEAVKKAAALKPDVVLMDLRMPGLDGAEATRQIVHDQPEVKVLILSTFETDNYVIQALQAGASGYLLKDAEPSAIAASIVAALSGERVMAGAVANRVLDMLTGASTPKDQSHLREAADLRSRPGRPLRGEESTCRALTPEMGDLHRRDSVRGRETARSPDAGRVLLAIGDAAFADLYRETLESVGWHVEVVNDWRSTQERLLNSRPEVLVLDTLRDLRQIDALEKIRSHPATRGLPVILLTDSVEAGDLERARELGVLDLLIKSRATRQTLPRTLSRLLEKRTDSPGNGSETSRPRSTESA